MKGIDVYHGDSLSEGQQLKAVPEKAYKESAFVIVKATQGVSYKYTSFFHAMVKRSLQDGKLVGAYHYAAGNDAVKEADYFLSVVKSYIGKILLCLDWEGAQNSKFGSTTWCKKFIDRVKKKTGVTCVLYTGLDGIKQNKTLANKVPLWFAGYPKPMATGWTIPKWKYDVSPWSKYTIWQYTSSNEKVDRNVTDLTVAQWQNMAASTIQASATKEDQRQKVIDAATMLLGIKEGSAEHKMIIDQFNKSGLCTRYKMTTKDAWCATFVSFLFIVTKLAGKQGSGALFQCAECSCAKMIELAKKQGIWKESDSYVPKKADVVLYDWQDSGKGDNTGNPDHVGVVEKVSGNTITVVEGNYNDAVGERKIAVNGKYIRGFIVPKYDTGNGTSSEPSKSTKKTSGISYYKKYTGKSKSLVDALKAIGVKDTSLSYRKKIAAKNGISSYSGTASQNTKMLSLLKAGKLIKP